MLKEDIQAFIKASMTSVRISCLTRFPRLGWSQHLSLTNLVLPYFKQALIKHDHVSEIVGLKCGEFPVDIKCL